MRDDRESDPDEGSEATPTGRDESPVANDREQTAAGRDGSVSSAGARPSPNERPPALNPVIDRLRADPGLWTPFFVAGCLLFAVDLLRERDSLPAVSGVDESTIHVSYAIYPTGTIVMDRPLGALVDLQLPWLGYALALEVAAVAAIGVAGWLTMARASDEPFRSNRVLIYVGGVALLRLLSRAGGYEYTTGNLLVGLAVLVLVLIVAVRLFLVPITVLREGGILAPIGASWRYSRGHGSALIGMIFLVGIGSWVLAHVPAMGTVLSATIAGTVHAVSLVVLYERCAGA